jgi:hypothetical protein
MAGSYEHGKEPLGPKKGRIFDYINDYVLLKNDSLSRSCSVRVFHVLVHLNGMYFYWFLRHGKRGGDGNGHVLYVE